LPTSVHRASLAVYTELPVLQLQRDQELLALCGSILRQGNEPDLRMRPSTLPAFELLFKSCNREAATEQFAGFYQRKVGTQYSNWDIHSPVDVFLQTVNRFGLLQLLPEAKLLSSRRAPNWDHRRWKAGVTRATKVLSIERLLNESRGYVYSYRSWRSGNLVSPLANKAKKYGTKLVPLLGIPAQHRLPHLELLADAMELTTQNLSFSVRTMAEETNKQHV